MTNTFGAVITDKQKQELMQHPDFAKEMGKAVEALKVDEIHWGTLTDLQEDIFNHLSETPFLSMGMDLETYTELVEKDAQDWGVGLIEKMTTLALKQSPKVLLRRDKQFGKTFLVEFINEVLAPYYKLHDHCAKLLQEAHKKTIEKLFLREKLTGK